MEIKGALRSAARRLFFAVLTVLLLTVQATAAGCPPEGDGGDTILNRLKNRSDAPHTYQEMSVGEFMRFTPNLGTRKYRTKFTAEQNAYIEEREKKGVSLVGFILGAKRSGPESCNCHDSERLDFHIWIGAQHPTSANDAKAMRADSVVVEPTPSGQSTHEKWILREFTKLVKAGAKVRISGWVMYDPEHPDQIGKTRGTLWEIHPVTKIEVWENGQWEEF